MSHRKRLYEEGRTALELAELLDSRGDTAGAMEHARHAVRLLADLGFTSLAKRAERVLR